MQKGLSCGRLAYQFNPEITAYIQLGGALVPPWNVDLDRQDIC
jgi:hypothetical protein